jgi:hypothetical protein
MEGVPKASRRNVLRNGLLFLAGAVGLGVAGARASGVTGAGSSVTTTLRLSGKQWHLFATDRRRGEIPLRGDSVSTHGILHGPDGKKIGEFYSAGMVLGHPLGAGPLGAANLEMHTFNLLGGTIAGMGSATPGESVFAIVGGTGRYAGASGSYVARQHPLELGGNGTAEFRLTLKTEEGTHANGD